MLGRYITWWGLIAQLLWVVAIAWDPTAMRATPLSTLAELFHHSRVGLIIALVASSVSTYIAMKTSFHIGLRRLSLLVPQQFFLLLAAGGALMAVYHGTYADGVVRTSAFIAADQAPWILAALLYSASIIDDFGGRRAWTHRAG